MPAESTYRGDALEQHASSMDGTSSGEEEEGSSNETRLSPETAAAGYSAPYIGQRFLTHDAAYEFYGGFAKRCGFSIRRHRTEGKEGVGKGLTRRYFVCHRAGNAPAKPFSDGAKPQRNRKSSRCGCQAYLRIGRDAGAGGPEWRVTGFSDHHNHELLRQDQVRCLPAYRVISDSDRDRILLFAKSGISVQQMMRIMELEKCLKPGSLPFTEKDVRNLIHSFRRFDQEEEKNVDLLKMCRNYKEKDPSFKYLDRNEQSWDALLLRLHASKGGKSAILHMGITGLTASPRVSKSINDFIQRLLSAQRRLSRFIEQVALVVEYKDQAGEQQNLQNISFKTAAPMEGHAAALFTPYAFSKLQDELVVATHYASLHLEGNAFLVRHHTKTEGGCIVTWNEREELISCSCQLFESSGILCRHALRVLTTLNYFQIPDHYLPVRWHRTLPTPSKSLNGAPNHSRASERVKTLQSIISALASEAAESDERMDLATHEVLALLSRIRQQPVLVNGSGDSAQSSLAAVTNHCISSDNVHISK
ncbi:unnamed protein product [Alopecurus aequalis]